jgi:hypothetical protein
MCRIATCLCVSSETHDHAHNKMHTHSCKMLISFFLSFCRLCLSLSPSLIGDTTRSWSGRNRTMSTHPHTHSHPHTDTFTDAETDTDTSTVKDIITEQMWNLFNSVACHLKIASKMGEIHVRQPVGRTASVSSCYPQHLFFCLDVCVSVRVRVW